MKTSKSNMTLKILGYLLFCAIMFVFTTGLAMGNFMNVKQDRSRTKYEFMFIFSVFMYISYLFWGKGALIIPVLLVSYLIYTKFFRVAQEKRYTDE